MTQERKLTDLTPRCIKLDTWKLDLGSSKTYEHVCGLRTTSSGWPLPGDGETEIGRWNVMGAGLMIDLNANPLSGPLVHDGSLGLLVTDKALRGSFYDGKGRIGKLSPAHHVLTFYWPYSLMAAPAFGTYEGLRVAVGISDPDEDGHLVLDQFTKPKSTKPDDFLSPVFSMKNRCEEFVDQLVEALARFPSSGDPHGASHDPQATCPTCSAALLPPARFCGSCGAKVPAPLA